MTTPAQPIPPTDKTPANATGWQAVNRPDLAGKVFRVNYYDCSWTVLSYHRGGNWICEEPAHKTTCHFYESEILKGLIE